jgi:ABC-2 type transport system permease protein
VGRYLGKADTLDKTTHRGPLGEVWGAVGFVERNFALYKRYSGWIVVVTAYAAVNTVIIGLIGKAAGNEKLVLYLIIGSVLWAFLSQLFQEICESMAWEHWEGTLEVTFSAPLKRFSQLLGVSAFSILYSLFKSLIIMAAMLLFFRIDLSGADLLSASVVLLVGSVSFLGMGIASGVLPILSRERGFHAARIFLALLLLVSGVYYPIAVLPAWLRPFSVVSPATYALRSMRAALLDGAGLREIKGDVLILLTFCVVSVPLGFAVFAVGERWAKWKGKLKVDG